MNLDREIIKGHIESVILSLLNQENLYGYEISKKIKKISNNKFEIKDGTLYVVLKRLENMKLVTSCISYSKSGGGKRKYFYITKEGQYYLKIKKEEWNLFKNILNIFLEGESNYEIR